MDEVLREALILATLILHPGLISRFESALSRLDLTGDDHNRLRVLILAHSDAPDLSARIAAEMPAALDALMARPHLRITPVVRQPGNSDQAALCIAEALAKLDAARGARREIEDAMEDVAGLVDEGLTWRVNQAVQARHRADRPEGTATPDLGEDRDALSKHLQEMIDKQVWIKKIH
ncbi:MAG: hypothetical protein V4516_12085 [Pseudomonadota bacterium]